MGVPRYENTTGVSFLWLSTMVGLYARHNHWISINLSAK